MHTFMPGYSKALAEAVAKLESDPSCKLVTFSNGSGLRLTRDDAQGAALKQKGAKCLGTQVYKDRTYLIFGP